MRALLSVQEYDDAFKQMVVDISPYCDIDVVDLENFSLNGYDIFIGKKLSSQKLKDANKLKCIFAYKTGVDDFPLKELKEKNITLVNSHANSKVIAEYAFGLAMSLVNHITKFDYDMRNDIWYDNSNLYWESIFDKKIGLLGYGYIGKEIHKILLDSHIESYTIDRGNTYNNIGVVNNLKELVQTCDVIISSVPKVKETDNLFDKNIFELMENKYLVNVGRANVINEMDLYHALKNKKLKGAAIDTWNAKPKNKNEKFNPSQYDFKKLDNIIMSPHAAMRVKNGFECYLKDISDNVISYVKHNKLRNVVCLDKGY